MYGRYSIGFLGRSPELSADGKPRAKIGGVTVDWNTVAAVSGTPLTLESGTIVPVGQKYLGAGQTVVLIASNANGGAPGMYGPYDPAASDGRQTIGPGVDNYLLNRDAFQVNPRDDYPEAITGGKVWLARLKNAGTGVTGGAYAVANTTTGAPGTNAQQTVSATGTPTAGGFTLGFMYGTTAVIPYNASAAAVQAALTAMDTIGAGNLTCTGGALPGTPVVCTFTGALAGAPQPLITAISAASLANGPTLAALLAAFPGLELVTGN